MAGTVTEMGPRGYYLAHEVGVLAGVSGKRVGQWARRGFIRSSQDSGTPRIYSYQDVAEAIIVHELIERGLTPRAIREAVEGLRETRGTEWPLAQEVIRVPIDHPASKRWGTDKQKRAVIVSDDGALIDAASGAPVLTDDDLEEVRSALARGGWAARDLDLQHIEVDPERLSGRPVIKGTRVPAAFVARVANAPGGRDTLREDYDLSSAEIEDAVAWWATVRDYAA